MPRLSDELRNRRRQHVLTSAWSCFSREGFHATSMDQVIAATGMSSSAVYRYFRSKDELIDATVDEAFGLAEDIFTELLEAEPTPDPAATLTLLTASVHHRSDHQDYDLSRLAMQAWTEALRRPHLHDRVRDYYLTVRANFEELARRWHAAGLIDTGTQPHDLATLLVTLMPGLIVMEHMVGPVSAAPYVSALSAPPVKNRPAAAPSPSQRGS